MTTSLPFPVPGPADAPPVVRLRDVGLRYGTVQALINISLELPAGCIVGLIGPDGVGKSSMLSLISGTRQIQAGEIEVLGGQMQDVRHRRRICARIAYMPQGLGKNLYSTLSVFENVDFFGRLFGHERQERERRIAQLLGSTGLEQFADRQAGQLSGGMKQKLALCCALIHDPDLLVLDEPTTGVDPLSRRQFWNLIRQIQSEHPALSIVVATAYMEEAAGFDWLVVMNQGQVLATGTPQELLIRSGADSLEKAFIALLPEELRREHRDVVVAPRFADDDAQPVIEAQNLTKRFGDFTAVNCVNFRIQRGEIFGFLGSNGCGKTTTMKMLTGLLPASEGQAWLLGKPVNAHNLDTRRRVGYMSQSFSLYSELTVRQNFVLHARLFHVPPQEISNRVSEMAERFGLTHVLDTLPDALPLGLRQRLSLAVAVIHKPELLILDEPTSGVDPMARDAFWQLLIDLSRQDRVTIFISTHFVNEAQRCDRISLMHAGQVLVSDSPAALMAHRGIDSLEEAFIEYLREAAGKEQSRLSAVQQQPALISRSQENSGSGSDHGFSRRRLWSYSRREALELRRDPIRLTLAAIGSVILLIIMGYGISLDVENLTFAALDRDQTTVSRGYIRDISGSRYFTEKRPLQSYAELDQRMKAGEISLAIEIPPDFGRDLARGRPVEVGIWVDGSMPTRAETVRNYIRGMHAHWLKQQALHSLGQTELTALATIETRFRYNPDVKSIVAMVPAVIPLLLLLIPAILTALSVVREKELGSIVNLYVTPVTRLEFLLGKQLPYVLLGMFNFLLMTLLAIVLFQVPLTGSLVTQLAGACLYVMNTTAIGLLISTFMRSQIAAIFGTAVLTILPASQFCGMIDPVSSLEGGGALIGRIYPTTHFLTISRGTYSKGLNFWELQSSFLPLLIGIPLLIGLATVCLRKQEV